MRINITDDADGLNWLNFGTLVESWIKGARRPTTVGELKAQLLAANVAHGDLGSDSRIVEFKQYPDGPENPLVITLPSDAMRVVTLQTVKPGPYNMPKFYDLAFRGAARKDLSQPEADAFALRRIGEYTINECC